MIQIIVIICRRRPYPTSSYRDLDSIITNTQIQQDRNETYLNKNFAKSLQASMVMTDLQIHKPSKRSRESDERKMGFYHG